MKNPKYVLISDVHVDLNSLPVAIAALNQALEKAKSLNIPLIIAGDLLDDKAVLRGEVIKALIDSLVSYDNVYILVGNHDRINEKSSEHSLEFLRKYATIVDKTLKLGNTYLIPYGHDLNNWTPDFPSDSTLIMHQGFQGAQMGDYIVDRSSIRPEKVKAYKVFSGHYHKHQTIETITYIGSPYTVTFGEANDGPKGFLVVFGDNSFTQVPTRLRKHVVVNLDAYTPQSIAPGDIVKVRKTVTPVEARMFNRQSVVDMLNITVFTLELSVSTDIVEEKKQILQDDAQLFESVLESISKEDFENAKLLYKEVLS